MADQKKGKDRPTIRASDSPQSGNKSDASTSDRKKTEEALRESQRTLSTLMSNLPGMAYRCKNDRDWTMEFVSDGCAALTGYSPDDLIHNRRISYGQVVHPEDRDYVWSRVQIALEQKEPFRATYRIKTSTGEEKWVWEQGVGVFSPEGPLIAIEGFITDITLRKRAEEELAEHRAQLAHLVRERTSELTQANEKLKQEIRERKQIEKSLRESERKFRAIFNQTFQFIGLMKPDGTLLEANKTALQFSGVQESEVLGKPFWETPWWAHSKELQLKLREGIESAAQGEFVRFEATHPAPDGSLAYVDFSIKPVKDENGKVVLLIPEGRDITERKRAEEALRGSEDTSRALLNAPTDSAVLLDSKGMVLAINETGAERLGKGVGELIGESIYQFLPPDVAQARRKRLYQALESGKPVRFEDERGARVYDINLYPILDGTGKIDRVAVYARDITEHKRALSWLQKRTADLIESEEKYRTLVENVPLVVYRLGRGGELLFINQYVEEAFGYRPAEFLANPELWSQKIYIGDRARVEKLREKCFRDGKDFIAEYRVRHKEGRIVYVMDQAIPLRGSDEVITSIDGIIMDVTGRVDLQKKLVRAEGLKTISEVSARLAHEIRNPLVSAGGFARRLMSSMRPDDPNRAKVEIIVKEVGRLESILRMILNYIQPLELHQSNHDPNQLVQDALRAVEAEIKDSHTHVDFQATPGLSSITVDGVQIRRTIETLTKNAMNQMPEGSTLQIATSQENKMFKLIMRYPVEHLSADDVEHFFYPFTTSRVTYDTLDLPMCKIIVDKHGGLIDVTLEKSGGLLIQMSLPL